MARPYRLTPARRAAILKAQKASARKRKRNRNLKVGVVAVGATAALVGAGVYRHKKSGSSIVVRKLHGPHSRDVKATTLTSNGILKKSVIGQSVGTPRKVPTGISFARPAVMNNKTIVKGTQVWMSGTKTFHHRYQTTVGGFGRGYEITYTHSKYKRPSQRKANLGMPTMPNPPRPTRKPDPTVPFYIGRSSSWPRGYINPDSKKNKARLKTNRKGIYDVVVIPKAKKKKGKK